jgi:hypothetical protein
MRQWAHFATVFGIAWAIITALYILVILRVGFGVGWRAESPAPRFAIDLIFYAWPVVPAAFIAVVGELVRVAMIRRH